LQVPQAPIIRNDSTIKYGGALSELQIRVDGFVVVTGSYALLHEATLPKASGISTIETAEMVQEIHNDESAR
jgi:hypothetical protein